MTAGSEIPAKKIVVIFDSNALRGKDWIQGAISDLVKYLEEEPKLIVEMYIPEVVEQEWLNNFCEIAKTIQERHGQSSRKLNYMLGSALEVLELNEPTIRAKGVEHLKNLRISTLTMDYSTVNLADLLNRALAKRPPFKSDSDAGFKDAMIAETIAYHIETAFKDDYVVIISKDGTLNEYLLERMGGRPTLLDSVPDFQSHLKLKVNELTDKLAGEATKVFYLPNVKTTLFYSQYIGKKVRMAYAREFPDEEALRDHLATQPKYTLDDLSVSRSGLLPTYSKWHRLGGGGLRVSDTVFIERRGQRQLVWENTVTLTVEYEVEPSARFAIMESPGTVRHQVDYTIRWTTIAKKKDLLTGPRAEQELTISNEHADYIMNSFLGRDIDAEQRANAFQRLLSRAPEITTVSGLATTSVPPASPQIWLDDQSEGLTFNANLQGSGMGADGLSDIKSSPFLWSEESSNNRPSDIDGLDLWGPTPNGPQSPGPKGPKLSV